MTVLLASFAIILLAAATYGLTGFGFALVAVPLLAIVTDPRTAGVAMLIAFVPVGPVLAVRDRDSIRWSAAALLCGAALLGMPLGLLVLVAASERLLTGIIGVCVLGSALLLWRGLKLRDAPVTVLTAGMISGVLSTSTATSGPPMVVALRAMGYEPVSFRATLSVAFTAMSVTALAGRALTGQMGSTAVAIGLVGIPAMLAGWACGNALFRSLDPIRFRRLVLYALAITGALTVLRAITS